MATSFFNNNCADDVEEIESAKNYADLAKDWAIKLDGQVDGIDFSSKFWALQAAESSAAKIVVEDGGVPLGSEFNVLNFGVGISVLQTAANDVQIQASGDVFTEIFTDGVDYTAGTSTEIVLDEDPVSEKNVDIYFDGVRQQTDQYGISGTMVTFTSAIPVGVGSIEVKYPRTLDVGVATANNILYGSTGATANNFFDQALITFNSVADMVAATWLVVGMRCKTLGYITPGDGGDNEYEIVAAATGVDDGGTFIDLSGSGLQAEGLFPGGFINSKQFGIVDASLPAGVTEGLLYNRDGYIADSGGTTDIRNLLNKSQLNGGFGAQQVITQSFQSELRHTSGTVVFGYGIQGFSRLGRLGSSTGDVTTFRGVEWHTANEGTGEINSAINFYAQDVDLLDGTGNINSMIGFLCGNQGHASRIPNEAIGYDCGNFTGGAALTAAFRTQMSSGSGKFAFYAPGGAVSAFFGGARFGDANAPTDVLETKGFAKLSRDGTVTASGSYHEINSDNNEYVVHIKNTHASTPNGVRIRFTGSAPDDNTQEFLRCEDSISTRLLIYSSGDVVNSNNSYGAISDANLKTEINDALPVLDKFRARRFVNYKLKTDVAAGNEKVLHGVIAQEEQLISPHLVVEDAGGESGKFLSYNYAGLAVEAAQAVKELVSIVDEQRLSIDSLLERVANLEGKK